MNKRFLSYMLTVMMALFIFPGSVAAAGSLSNFGEVNQYINGQFTDVASSIWYAPYVEIAYKYGLINGKSSTTFEPDSNLTVAEAIKLAACIHCIYSSGKAEFVTGTPWYQTYVDYALANGIVSSPYVNYNTNATRSEFAVILDNALPDEALTKINNVGDGAVPDVSEAYSYGPAVYELYRAGVLSGSDSVGTFYPNSYITRAEVAAIVTRMANTGYRKTLRLDVTDLEADEIFDKCSPAVFSVELYNENNEETGSASGFFISSSGIAVTNYHVIFGASSAKITTSDGKKYEVSGVYDYSKENDIALIQINGSNFPYLTTADSTALSTGSKVFAIGSPLGLNNTISPGIISSSSRMINGRNYIQITAAISAGSSGGALLNTAGQVIGVTAATVTEGQNLNLAVPIHLIDSLETTSCVPISTLLPDIKTYEYTFPTPDYGAFYNVSLYDYYFEIVDASAVDYYYYKISDISVGYSEYFNGYGNLLEQNGFDYFDEYKDDNGYDTLVYRNNIYGYDVYFGPTMLDGVYCMVVIVVS